MIDPALSTIASIPAGSEIQMIWSLFASAILGAIVGVERSIAGKQAGMRTYAMVSLGSCLFVVIGTAAAYIMSNFPSVNPLQIAGSIVLGVGFIGSGLAVLRGDGHAELTTASGIWVVAGIGMACGFGLYVLATVTTVLAVAVFSLFWRFEHSLRKNFSDRSPL